MRSSLLISNVGRMGGGVEKSRIALAWFVTSTGLRASASLHKRSQVLWSEIGSVGPCQRMPFNRKRLEILGVSQRFENGSVQRSRQINLSICAIVE